MDHACSKRWEHFTKPISFIVLLLLSCLAATVYAEASIQGSVFLDNNDNGVWDTGEPIRVGAVIHLVDEALENAGQGGHNTTDTDANGNYFFVGLNTGKFRIWTEIPAGMKQTAPVRQEGQVVFNHITITAPSPELTVNFGFSGKTADITINPDESVTVKDSEFTMLVKPNKTGTSTAMKVSKNGEKFEGTNTSTDIVVEPNKTRAGIRDGNDNFTITTGSKISDTGEESSVSVTGNRDGGYTIKTPEFPSMVTTIRADSTYTVVDENDPSFTFTVKADGTSTVTDTEFSGMVATVGSSGDTVVTDAEFPGMAATVNDDGSYIVKDNAIPGIEIVAHPDGSYTFIDEAEPTIEVTLDADGNYSVIDIDSPEVVLTVFEDGS